MCVCVGVCWFVCWFVCICVCRVCVWVGGWEEVVVGEREREVGGGAGDVGVSRL